MNIQIEIWQNAEFIQSQDVTFRRDKHVLNSIEESHLRQQKRVLCKALAPGLAHPYPWVPHMSISSLVATYLQVWILAVRAGGTSNPASTPVPVVEIFQFWACLPRHWEEPSAHEAGSGSSRHFEAPLTHLGAWITEKCHKMWSLGSLLTVSCVWTAQCVDWTELFTALAKTQASRLQPGRPGPAAE